MARRRMRLGAFLRRRWRVAGLLVVGLLGALLLLAITDRGHDPLWRARAQHVDQVAISPGGERVYALVRDDPAGPLTRLEARSGLDGGLVWKTDLNDSRALVAAGDDRVVVATDYPRAFVTTFDADGTPRAPVPLGGNPRALVVDGGVTAVLVQGNDSRVLLLSEGAPPRELRFGVLAHAMDLRAGRLAVGTAAGDVLAFDALGTPMGNLSVGFQVRSLRLSGDGLSAALGGSRSDLTGAAALARLDSSPRVAWTVPTSAPVGLVDADDAMRRVVAVEETTPEATMRVLQASDGRQAWGKVVVGSVAGDD
ncbi:MAG TPA: hypothetical protein VHH36_07510, partial [Candidatus Thermoplasmatota archaeon]|nr:hypothetical protein [Candidatus Thermoplasmatota archaeon]